MGCRLDCLTWKALSLQSRCCGWSFSFATIGSRSSSSCDIFLPGHQTKHALGRCFKRQSEHCGWVRRLLDGLALGPEVSRSAQTACFRMIRTWAVDTFGATIWAFSSCVLAFCAKVRVGGVGGHLSKSAAEGAVRCDGRSCRFVVAHQWGLWWRVISQMRCMASRKRIVVD